MLKYLFEVEYKDGTRFEQNPEDTSVTKPYDPVKEYGGSAFSDVRVGDVARFHLVNQEIDNDVWTVDLTDGHFEHNFRPFVVYTVPFPYGGGPLKLIYTKVRNENFKANIQTGAVEHIGYEYVGFRIGFETHDNKGKTIQQTIIVN